MIQKILGLANPCIKLQCFRVESLTVRHFAISYFPRPSDVQQKASKLFLT